MSESDAIVARIRDELPELDLLSSGELQASVAQVWADFLDESTYDRIAACPGFPGLASPSLAMHTRHVVRNCALMMQTNREYADIDCDADELLAAALLHDASKLVEFDGPEGALTSIGRSLLHAQLAGVRCLEAGLSEKIAYMVTMHPYSPPHVHMTPRFIEHVILSWADILAADSVFFVNGQPTHLEIEKRFFSL